MTRLSKKKLLIFTNSDAHFYAHLLPIAKAAKDKGYLVQLLTDFKNHKDKIAAEGIEPIHITISRASLSPLTNLKTLFVARKIIEAVQPDVIHNFTIKPVVFCSLLKCMGLKARMVNSFLGMGTMFISNSIKYKLARFVTTGILNKASKYSSVIFNVQNKDDKKLLVDLGAVQNDRIISKCSVGVEVKEYDKLHEPKGQIVFALVGRMLIDKGVREFIAAAKILKSEGIEAEFWLVGEPDPGNITSIPMKELQEAHNDWIIRYKGYTEDIASIWHQAHVAVLPSYREGLSRSLLEAGVYGRAIITTDAPGGRELIQDNVNGLLVKLADDVTLADAMRKLVVDGVLRKKLAAKIRQDVQSHYDSKQLAHAMVDLYSLL